MAQVQAATDTAAHCRAIGGAAAATDNQEKAVKFLNRAYQLDSTGAGQPGTGAAERDDLFTQWSKQVGLDYKNPEDLKKVYTAIAEMHRTKAEKLAKVTQATRTAATRAARGQPPVGKMRTPKRAP